MSYATTQADLFRQIHPRSMNEAEYEKRILDNAVNSFPKHYVVPCKKRLPTSTKNVVADLAMINKNLHEWSIIEVEVDDHPFEGHILPQVEKLVEHDYLSNDNLHEYLINKILEVYTGAQRESLIELFRGVRPTVKVMLSAHCKNHIQDLRRNAIECILVDIFLTHESRPMLKVDGKFPEVDRLYIGELIPSSWGSFKFNLASEQCSIQGDYFIASYEEMLCTFKQYHTADGLVVRPIERCPWKRSPKQLYRLADNQYVIE